MQITPLHRNSQEADYPGASAIPLRLPNEESKNRQHKLIDKHVQFHRTGSSLAASDDHLDYFSSSQLPLINTY